MTVVIHMVNKNYVTLDRTNDIEGVWAKINSGEPIKTGRWDDEVIVNKDNVTSVTKGR